MARRLPSDFPVGLVVVTVFVAAALAFVGLIKLALALVLLAVAIGTVRRRWRSRREVTPRAR